MKKFPTILLATISFLAACAPQARGTREGGSVSSVESQPPPKQKTVEGIATPGASASQPVLSLSPTPPTPSITPIPTFTPSPTPPTPTPLPQSIFASCPVDLPDQDVRFGFGNLERTMFIGLWPSGTVYFCPGCPGSLSADGSLAMKFWFHRTVPGEVVIEGRRLDEPGPVAHLDTLRGPEDGYGETGFHPAGLVFPSQGCWEVTASVAEERMTFVTLVIWIPFEPLWLGWVPEGTMHESTDLSGYPQTFQHVYRTAEGAEVIVETSLNPWEETDPAAVQKSFTVDGEPATCIQVEGETAEALRWSSGGVNYRIRYQGSGLTCTDLLRMAQRPGG